MKRLLLIAAVLCLAAARARAAELDLPRFVESIRITEGVSSRHPYGVMLKTDNPKRICENTVRNNWARWQKAGAPGNYIDWLADRYCPKSADAVGNARWRSNMRKIYGSI